MEDDPTAARQRLVTGASAVEVAKAAVLLVAFGIIVVGVGAAGPPNQNARVKWECQNRKRQVNTMLGLAIATRKTN